MVLLAVKNEKQTTLTTICLKLDLANNTLTPVIKKLVAKKWLIKERSAKDSRCLVISLNKASLKTLEEIREKVGYVQHLFSQLTELPIDQLIKQHMTLNANLLELNQKMDSEDS
ncbi:hypothetical protein JCM15457_263 [Liquorilactobacillus sucicola DSM 21376 = JCM 15457]|uniref:Transcriptional regulator SarA/SarZ/Rot-like helix-turn-helix domain-containing protein n=2 Tax=Liquorilactobacillus sucicola TaxID=519050 RepID=A0A023CUB8_9LACO|nr:hypothetical protein FD15_GL001882 [Liquorilactobacillus sucicola DSM 21376 = JCM 15457]GAJ25399.1 hypothetical protein JCM15457_263 [Liquorilactobacillus sucicola DSM 21376 = JCM 15457]